MKVKRIPSFVIILIFSIIITIPTVNGATPQRKIKDRYLYKQANKYLDNNKYKKALEIYNKLLKKAKYNSELNYKIGVCYFNLAGNNNKAIEFLEKAIRYNRSIKNIPHKFRFQLAKAYHKEHRFNKSISLYKQLLDRISHRNVSFIKEVEQALKVSKNAAELIKKPVHIKIVNLGGAINSAYSDHSPSISADEQTMVFTSRRKGTGGKLDADGQYFEDIYMTKKIDGVWQPAKGIDDLNTNEHDASISISPDGRELYIYKANNIVNNKKNVGDIFVSKLERGRWSTPKSLGKNINSPYKENDASISADGNTIYFSSNRPGGFGGMDIYMAKKQENGEWGKAVNLGETINTKENDDAPFIFYDNTTLYFSSAGHKTMGGLDIFKSEFKNGKWQAPVNLGYPINSVEEDIFYKPAIDGKHAYLASYRKDNLGETDIYLLTIPEKKKSNLYVYKGRIIDEKGTAIDGAKVELLEKQQKIKEYLSDESNGNFFFIVDVNKNYHLKVTADGFIPVTKKITSNHIQNNSSHTVALKSMNESKPINEVVSLQTDIPESIPLNRKYTIQIMALKENFVPASYFKNLQGVKIMRCNDGYVRYFYGIYNNEEEAEKELPNIIKKGCFDAFTRVYFEE